MPDTEIIIKLAIGTAILFCPVCCAIKKFYLFLSNIFWEDYQCPDCHVIQKYKVDKKGK